MMLNLKNYLIVILAVQFSNLNSAIGCQSFEHTVDYWNVALPINQECTCACRQADSNNKGYCYACGHYGDPERGEKTTRVLAHAGIILP